MDRAARNFAPAATGRHPAPAPSAARRQRVGVAHGVDNDVLFGSVYGRLKAMAGWRLAHAHGTLDATALVHELYLRMHGRALAFEHPEQFLAYAARAMRHLLIDRARQRQRRCHGGDGFEVTMTGCAGEPAIDNAERALSIDQALRNLSRVDARAARVVELVYFRGLTLQQPATALGLCRRTVDRDWQFARAFIRAELG